jgi:ubiquitin-conjugating enzyme E2 C
MELMMAQDLSGCTAFPAEDSLFNWTATIPGPDDSCYAGLTYKLTISFPENYPMAAPILKFGANTIFHPNVDQGTGSICLDILKEKWSSAYGVRTILVSLRSLLTEPNNDSPLNVQAAGMWANQAAFKQMVVATFKKSEGL